MTDRELLELAAKAAGIKVRGYYEDEDSLLIKPGPGLPTAKWNPRDNSADALRLAVQLEMLVDAMDGRVVAGGTNSPEVVIDFKIDEDDPYAATRRAIVRAAAAISKEMK